MNIRYLLWLMTRTLRQPVSLLLVGIYAAIIAALAFMISFEMSGQTIRSITLWRFPVTDAGVLMEALVPSATAMLTLASFFLFLIATTAHGEESLYHPMNAVLLVTPLTRKQLYTTTGLSAALVFTLLFALFAFLACLAIGAKTGLYHVAFFAEVTGWMTLVFITGSALSMALLPIFKKATPVFILIMGIVILSPYLKELHEWYMRALDIALPAVSTYAEAAMNSLFQREEAGNLIFPLAVSFVYCILGMFIYDRQEVK